MWGVELDGVAGAYTAVHVWHVCDVVCACVCGAGGESVTEGAADAEAEAEEDAEEDAVWIKGEGGRRYCTRGLGDGDTNAPEIQWRREWRRERIRERLEKGN